MTNSLAHLSAALADRYGIEREIGAGGMATVYLADDLKHNRKVAVKVLRPELATALGPERFLKEIEVTANLQHPNILPLYDSGEADGFLYYVMPYVEGESLRERLDREGKLPVEDVVRLCDDTAAALSYANDRGIVHRDVKPENIMLTGGRAVVADFGIARAMEVAGQERLTGTGLAVGTPAYMSPEQGLGGGDVDARSDVYALGCVVYEMVGGRAPFEGPTPQALLAKHAVDVAPNLRAGDSEIPVFVERAVERALAKNPADRFQSARAFADALTTGTVVARVGKRRWRRRTVAAVAGSVLFLAAAGWWLGTITGGPAIQRLAVLPPTNLMNDPEQDFFVQGMHNALITELGQIGITVIGRTSVMRYRDTEMRIREIANELGVDAIIESAVFWWGDSVGIEARLVDGGTEEALWSQSYDSEARNVLTVIRGLTGAIAGEIQLALTPQEEARLARADPVDPEAYEAHLKGRMYFGRLTATDLDIAMQYFELALQKDPDYALAHLGVAGVWSGRQQMGIVPPGVAAPPLKASALRAFELDSTTSEVRLRLAGIATWTDWDWDAAETAFRRSIALNPNNASARRNYSHFLNNMGRPDEAMAQIERALELDPFNVLTQAFNGIDLLMVRRYDDVIVQMKAVVRTVPNHPMGLGGLMQAYQMKGMDEEALEALRTLYDSRDDRDVVAALTRGYDQGGYEGAMRLAAETLAARADTTFVAPTQILQLYLSAGMTEETLDWLEKGFDARDPNMPYIDVIPMFDPLRDDPRFQDLLRRMNFPR